MPIVSFRTAALAWMAAVAIVVPAAARVDVTIDFDKSFDFKAMRTYTWQTPQPGLVKMARTKDDDPETMRARAEPVILEAVAKEIGQRGLTPASDTADLTITYYLLLSTTMSAQTLGQFLPAVSDWGLPPFTGATQSLKVMNQGSLVLDLSARGNVVWRGLARANIKFDATDAAREALIREAIHDLLRRYPPRS